MPEELRFAFGVLGITPGIGSGSTYFGMVSGSSVPPGSGAASEVAANNMKPAADANPRDSVSCNFIVMLPVLLYQIWFLFMFLGCARGRPFGTRQNVAAIGS